MRILVAALVLTCPLLSLNEARSETLQSALASAYSTNPTLNAARAEARSIDQQVAIALSNYRPSVSADGSLGVNSTRRDVGANSGGSASGTDTVSRSPGSVGVTVNQNLFRGFRTANATKEAEAAVQAAHYSLANTEQNTLQSAAEAYANVVRDNATVGLRKQNIQVLSEQLRATRDRFEVGEVTRTDVAQAEARLSASQFQLNAAESDLLTSRATFREVIGREPTRLQRPTPLMALVPPSLNDAIAIGAREHPAILSSRFAEESASFAVRVAEGALLPTVRLEGSASYVGDIGALDSSTSTAQILGIVSIPIYQGGAEYAAIRQAKETRTQRALQVDVAREQVRAAILSAWGGLQAARASIQSGQAQIRAAQIALDGVREEARVGQRTTLEVLDAQQELLDAQVSVVSAERDVVVASYALVSAIGRLQAKQLALNVRVYDPKVNARKTRDLWGGLRVPSGQ